MAKTKIYDIKPPKKPTPKVLPSKTTKQSSLWKKLVVCFVILILIGLSLREFISASKTTIEIWPKTEKVSFQVFLSANNEIEDIDLIINDVKLEKDAENDFAGTLLGADTVNYGYQLTTEVEFNFTKPLAEGLSLSAGLPVGFEYSPEVVYDDETADSENASYTLSVNPNASIFVTSLPLPLEFKVSYKYPIMGQNAMAKNVLTTQIKAYMKF